MRDGRLHAHHSNMLCGVNALPLPRRVLEGLGLGGGGEMIAMETKTKSRPFRVSLVCRTNVQGQWREL